MVRAYLGSWGMQVVGVAVAEVTIVKEDVRKNATANEKLICVQIYDVMPVYRPQASFIPRFGFKSVR